MRLRTLLASMLLLATAFYGCQQSPSKSEIPMRDIAAPLHHLASDGMQGREVGTHGAMLASDYIASMMELYGLAPCGDMKDGQPSYFQNFELTRCPIKQLELSLILSGSATVLTNGIDYTTERICKNVDATTPLVFVGYGINAQQNGYNDYEGLDVKGKTVVLLNGFPGHSDTTSAGWKSFLKVDKKENTSLKVKRMLAWQQGAAAVIVVSTDDKAIPTHNANPRFPAYEDAEYLLNSEFANPPIPCFKLSANASNRLLEGTGIAIAAVEQQQAAEPKPVSKPMANVAAKMAIAIDPSIVEARNVLGMVKGKDTTKYVVVAAHYDHLGMRGQYIYNGADDNASGVAGMLAIAKYWGAKEEKPACNIIFASWTAEEKGMIGSRYFVQTFSNAKQSILLGMNFDMISRSEPTDTAGRIVTVGRLKGCDEHKAIEERSNAKLANPLVLDLWETAGGGGSDYISFAGVQIPIMSFFSGMHADYHSPADLPAKLEWAKLKDIVNLANNCLEEFMATQVAK